jgi:hypothetical protein
VFLKFSVQLFQNDAGHLLYNAKQQYGCHAATIFNCYNFRLWGCVALNVENYPTFRETLRLPFEDGESNIFRKDG